VLLHPLLALLRSASNRQARGAVAGPQRSRRDGGLEAAAALAGRWAPWSGALLLVFLVVLLPASVEGHCTNVSIANITGCQSKYPEPSTSATASDICTYLNDFGKCYTTDHCCDDDHNGNWTFFKNTLSKFTPKIEEAKYSCVVFCRNANITKYRYPAIPANPNPSDGTRMVPVGIFGLVTCVSMLAIALL
jgi:hypothetical protein